MSKSSNRFTYRHVIGQLRHQMNQLMKTPLVTATENINWTDYVTNHINLGIQCANRLRGYLTTHLVAYDGTPLTETTTVTKTVDNQIIDRLEKLNVTVMSGAIELSQVMELIKPLVCTVMDLDDRLETVA